MNLDDYKKLTVLFPWRKDTYSLTNTSNVKDIICNSAYRDVQRHFHGIGKHKDKRDEGFELLAENICEYFNNPPKTSQTEFDAFHRELCDKLIEYFNAFLTNGMTYGKAQKLINITFKHLFCTKEAMGKLGYFQYCHTPIDNTVLNWCAEKIGLNVQRSNWSNIKDYNVYKDIQKGILNYLNSPANTEYRFSDGTSFTPLAVDFYVWAEAESAKKQILSEWENIENSKDQWECYKEHVKELQHLLKNDLD